VNKKQLLVDAGFSPDMTEDLVNDAWIRLQRFFKATNEVNDRLVTDPKATEEKIVDGLKRWAQWEKEKQAKQAKEIK